MTNIVIATVSGDLSGTAVCERLREKGGLVHLLRDERLRCVTHLDFSDEEIDFAIDCLREEFQGSAALANRLASDG